MWLKSLFAPGTFRTRVFCDLVLKKIVGTNNFSAQSIKINLIIKRLVITLMNSNWRNAWSSTQSRLATSDSMTVPNLRLIYRWDGWAWCCVCGQAHHGLLVGFLLLCYLVVCTFESLSLFYLLFLSRFICTIRWCTNKFGILHANQWSMCLDPHQI